VRLATQSFNRLKRASMRAFSLIELMVVLVLVGVMTALIVPEMKGTLEDELLRSNARKLVGVVHFAYSQSISLHQPHRLRIDQATGRCFVEGPKRAPTAEPEAAPVATAKELLGNAAQLDSRLTFEIKKTEATPVEEAEVAAESLETSISSPDAVTFFADGTAEAAEIILRDREGFGLALRINPITARVQLVELDRAPFR
jgi:type II secretion system protein H